MAGEVCFAANWQAGVAHHVEQVVERLDVKAFVKVSRARHKDGDGERWDVGMVSPTLNLFDLCGDTRSCVVVVGVGKEEKPPTQAKGEGRN